MNNRIILNITRLSRLCPSDASDILSAAEQQASEVEWACAGQRGVAAWVRKRRARIAEVRAELRI